MSQKLNITYNPQERTQSKLLGESIPVVRAAMQKAPAITALMQKLIAIANAVLRGLATTPTQPPASLKHQG
jgi:hypothetical protein